MSLRLFEQEFFDPFLTEWRQADRNKAGIVDIACDLKEKKDSFELTAEVAGVPKENIKVEQVGNILKLSGEVKKEKEEKDDKHHLVERTFGSFERQFRLPKSAKMDDIKAKYENGLLKLTIPKQVIEAQKANAIKIE